MDYVTLGLVRENSIWLKDRTTGVGITGEAGNFVSLLTVNEADATETVTVSEVDSIGRPGLYDVSVTTDMNGTWDLLVTHPTYNPWGWHDRWLVQTQATVEDLNIPTPSQITAEILDEADAVDGYTVREVYRVFAAALGGLVANAPGNPVFQAINGCKPRITAVCDAGGNRTSVTIDATQCPGGGPG